jgi:glycerol-3-phosphate dehydrogenase (NAD(P)+)
MMPAPRGGAQYDDGPMRIAVLGAGSWGTALAAMAADAGHATWLWGRDPAAVREIAGRRENVRYLPGRQLPSDLQVTSDLAEAVQGAELVVLALPAASVRGVGEKMAPLIAPGAIVVCASKGFEERSRLTLDRVLAQAVPGAKVVLFSGPTFAVEIARGLPAAAVVAGADPEAAATVQRAFASERFRVYTTEDVAGVAVGGALKNVIAIAAGCADGLGFGNNARAALITRGLNELGRLALRLGGNPLTLAGLAGLGDLVLTCTGELSRNRKVGLALAAGEPLPSILARLGQVAEGVYSARVAADLARELGVDMPITTQVAAVLAGQRTPREAVADLLARESRAERG